GRSRNVSTTTLSSMASWAPCTTRVRSTPVRCSPPSSTGSVTRSTARSSTAPYAFRTPPWPVNPSPGSTLPRRAPTLIGNWPRRCWRGGLSAVTARDPARGGRVVLPSQRCTRRPGGVKNRDRTPAHVTGEETDQASPFADHPWEEERYGNRPRTQAQWKAAARREDHRLHLQPRTVGVGTSPVGPAGRTRSEHGPWQDRP